MTLLYYLVALPITVALGILIYVAAGAARDPLFDGSGDANLFVFFLKFAAGIIVYIIQWVAPLLLLWRMLSLGRIVRTKEQRRRQLARDDLAGTVARVSEVSIASPDRPQPYHYYLYLRPFSSTGKIPVLLKSKTCSYKTTPVSQKKRSHTNVWGDLETTIAEAIEPLGTFLALGRPGEHIGAGRVLTDDLHWKDEFSHLAHGAIQILVVPSTHPGTIWELHQLLSDPNLLRKTIFILPPKYSLRSCDWYHPYIDINKFDLGESGGNRGEAVRSDAIASMKELGIEFYDNENGLFLRIAASRQILAILPLWVPKRSLIGWLWDWCMSQTVVTLSTSHIRSAIRGSPQARQIAQRSDAIGYTKFYSRSNDTVIGVYDAAGNVIEPDEQAGDFKEPF